jgi:hypothetical protein
MARKATGHSRTTSSARTARKSTKKTTAVARRPSSGGGSRSDENMGDAFIKLLQSPFVAELVAVAATAALASLAEHGFTSGNDGRGKRAGKAVKEAGKAAAKAVGRRLGNEIDEIRKAAKGGAKA